MKTGLDFSRINNYDYIAFMDGDNQHSARDMLNICNKIVEINCDLVIGYRKDLRKLNFSKKIGTLILRNLFYILFRKKILDIQSGLRVFKRSLNGISIMSATKILRAKSPNESVIQGTPVA